MILATLSFLCILSESKNKILNEMKKLNEVRASDNTRTTQEYQHDTYQDPSLALASPSVSMSSTLTVSSSVSASIASEASEDLAGGWHKRPGFYYMTTMIFFIIIYPPCIQGAWESAGIE
jgi:hypothetical protein